MGYDLSAIRPRGVEKQFHFGAFSWTPLLEACGYLWPLTFNGGQWYCVFGVDKRLGTDYPLLISNDGFRVSAAEAKIMARCARNFVTVQRSLPEPDPDSRSVVNRPEGINRNDMLKLLAAAVSGGGPRGEAWPVKLRSDFLDRYERFADWAEKSGGFEVW